MEIRIDLLRKMNDELINFIVSKITYSVEDISRCHYEQKDNQIVIEYNNEADKEQIYSTVLKVIDENKSTRLKNSRIIKKINSGSLSYPGADENVKDWFNSESRVRRGIASELFELLDFQFKKISLKYQAELRKYSSLLNINTLQACNYIKTFPQNLYTVHEFPHEYKTLSSINTNDVRSGDTRQSKYVLPPAVCFHTYEELANSNLDGPKLFTAKESCFRHEVDWRVGRHRMNEFQMREIIFIGDSEFVNHTRLKIMEDISLFFSDLGFQGIITTAFDPFYHADDSSKGQFQLMGDMKFELVVELPNKDSFAVASFNDSKDSLCKAFGISDTKGNMLHSGCAAFGIDRWVLAILHYYGTDRTKWPRKIIDLLYDNKLAEEEVYIEN
jgi:hypothetical protein